MGASRCTGTPSLGNPKLPHLKPHPTWLHDRADAPALPTGCRQQSVSKSANGAGAVLLQPHITSIPSICHLALPPRPLIALDQNNHISSIATTKMPVDPKLHIDESIPWSEPAWLRGVHSPYYTSTHRELQRAVRQYVDTHLLPSALDWEEKGDVPPEEAERFCKSGIPFVDIPEPYRPADIPNIGGIPRAELDAFHFLIMSDEMSRVEGGVGIALAGASSIGAPPIVNCGTEEQKRKWLPGLFTRKTNFSLGITEPSGGSDVARIKTTAEKTPDGKSYIVNGVKKWITGTPWATHMTTAVRTGRPGMKGVSLLVIPMDSPGIMHQKIQNSGQNAGGASFVYLENVKVPVENLLGEENEGFMIIMKNFNKERFLLTVGCNRKARSCLAMSFQYAMKRETFGKPLIENQVIRRKLSEMAHRIEAHWAWLEQLAYHIKCSDLGWEDPQIASRVALLKVQGGQLIELAAREAAQIFGGAGYMKGGPGAAVEQINRDLRMLVVGGGSEEIIADLAVRLELAMMGGLGGAKL
ncbi:acyl-CoA dehydrogenase, partial [Metarhizium majus ARSEF 297]